MQYHFTTILILTKNTFFLLSLKYHSLLPRQSIDCTLVCNIEKGPGKMLIIQYCSVAKKGPRAVHLIGLSSTNREGGAGNS